LGNISYGSLGTGYESDDWTFSATANEVVNFQVVSQSDPNLVFDLTGPNGNSIFTEQGSNFPNVDLPLQGTYVVRAYSLDLQAASYAFEVSQATPTTLSLGQVYTGTFVGNGQSQLFEVPVVASQALKFVLTNSNSQDYTDLYARYDAIPSQQSYDYVSNGGGASQVLLVPDAQSGAWYLLVYANFLGSSSATFTLEAESNEVFVTSVSPGTGTTGSETTLTIDGAGFVPGSTVSLVGTNSTILAGSSTVDLPTEITAVFAANTVPAGT
jgi:hypothetical protein